MDHFHIFDNGNQVPPWHNDSMDVSIKGCFVGYDTVACIRRSVLSALMIVTFVLCFIKVGRFHAVHHEQVHHYVIFYMALVECIICIVNWMLSGHYPELDLGATALKVLQLVTLCHFHWIQAFRILHRETIARTVWFPLMGVFSTYIVAVAAIGILDVGPSWTECLKPYWVMLSAADFLGVQLFLIAGIYITRKINEVSTLECVKKTQKRNLWAVIFAFEVSAITGLVYDVTIKIVGDEIVGCSGIFADTQLIYSPVFFMFMIFKFCLPIWSLLAVLEPLPTGISYSEILATSHSGSLSGACGGHSVGSPYRVLRSYVFDDNAHILGLGSSPRSRNNSGSTNSENSEFSARHFFNGRVMPTLYIPGHGHILPPAPRPSAQGWNNPRDYWRSRQRVSSSGQLSAMVRNPSLSMISEEANSLTATSNQPLPELQRTSTPVPDGSRQNLLVDIHIAEDDNVEEEEA
uniref:Uncharacterized protein n=1 Tax=Daphnia galeata TaxID=27404 RepID=A0A8J2RE69_9CRUS|nr:unnamed protein product [Daphnia galeata]